MRKTKTYMDKLMINKEFRERFDEEYQNICIGEQIAGIRHRANLTQDALAKRIHTTKSAISRYENSDYKSYSMPLLNKIAEACGTVLKIDFVTKGTKKVKGKQKNRGIIGIIGIIGTDTYLFEIKKQTKRIFLLESMNFDNGCTSSMIW